MAACLVTALVWECLDFDEICQYTAKLLLLPVSKNKWTILEFYFRLRLKPNSERPTRLNSTQLNWKTENRSVFCQSATFWTFSELAELSWVELSRVGRSEYAENWQKLVVTQFAVIDQQQLASIENFQRNLLSCVFLRKEYSLISRFAMDMK